MSLPNEKSFFDNAYSKKYETEQFLFINAVRSNKDLMSIHCRC